MGKLTRRILAALSGTIVNKVDGVGTVFDVQPGDIIGLYRVRGVDPPELIMRKNGQPAQVTIPSALSVIHDALAIEMNIRLLFRTVDEAVMTNAQRIGILAREADGTVGGSEENPWA